MSNLAARKETVDRVISHLADDKDDKNHVYSSVGYPDKTLDFLKEMSIAIENFQVNSETLTSLEGLRS